MARNLQIIAGDLAQAHIEKNGLLPQDICAIPGAAGGPKGLILQGLDHFLFNHWLDEQALAARAAAGKPKLQMIGASIGAWRMAAASSSNPSAHLNRLADQYCEAQRYPKDVDQDGVSAVCKSMVDTLVDQAQTDITTSPHKNLVVWVNRGLKALYQSHSHPSKPHHPRKRGFAAAVLANSISRNRLANYFERWVFATHPDELDWLKQPFDRIPSHFQQLGERNLNQALLGSGCIPFILNAVKEINAAQAGQAAFEGPFWDGGLTDYHLALPYHRLDGLVLYPHFANKVTPGWLDKFLKTRKAKPAWMRNVVLLCPSPEFINKLPARKIPDRSDFKRYGEDHDLRIQHWRQAISQSNQLADEFAQWLEKPRFDK